MAWTLQCMVTMAMLFAGCSAQVWLKQLDVIYIPYKLEPSEEFGYGEDAVEQSALDPNNHYIYAVGKNFIHVIDYSDLTDIKRVHTETVDHDGIITDVQTCNRLVAVTFNLDSPDPTKGRIITYSAYDPNGTPKMTLHSNILVESSKPETAVFTADCGTLVAAVEGEIREKDGTPVDPEGRIAVITNPGLASANVIELDFTQFNAQVNTLVSQGVRYVYKGEGLTASGTFSKDLEPESVVIDDAGRYVYVNFQENNAVGRIDLNPNPPTVTDWLYTQGEKNLMSEKVDASDRDGGYNPQPWNIYALQQADAMVYHKKGAKEYLITANEGAPKRTPGISWNEIRRGKDFVNDDLIAASVSQTLQDALGMDSRLGRKEFTIVEGKDATGDKYEKFYVLGGRSFSVYEIKSNGLERKYDSGAELETRMYGTYPFLYNADQTEDEDRDIEDSVDQFSDDEGISPEALAVGELGSKTLLFIGMERPGQIAVYDINNPETPVFESINQFIDYQRSRTDTWEEMYENRNVSSLDPEGLTFIPASRSPSNKPLLAVVGATSGTVAIMEVTDDARPPTPTPPNSAPALSVSLALALFLAMMLLCC